MVWNFISCYYNAKIFSRHHIQHIFMLLYTRLQNVKCVSVDVFNRFTLTFRPCLCLKGKQEQK